MAFRKAVQGTARATSRDHVMSPPVRGLVTTEPLIASKPGGSIVLENWFPTRNGARLRGGSQRYAKVSTGPVTSMFTYSSGAQEKLFAADATTVCDITTVADANVIPSAAISSQTSGYYSTAQFGASSGDYLTICNGTDTPRYFNGSVWAAHTFTGTTASALSFVWSFAKRLWYVKKNSMSAFYLAADTINGALTEFSLAGIFRSGGYLVAGGAWSVDAGDGLDDKCVFISSTGEVAVYEGTDPSSPSDWRKVGVYQISPMMGIRATMVAGGDLLVATEVGVVPLSEAVNRDASALSLAAVSMDIEPDWRAAVAAKSGLPWEIMKWPSNSMMVVSVPISNTAQQPYCFVKNLETGAWAKFTGWDVRCMAHFSGRGYYGANNGRVYRMETGGNDDGMPYVCTYVSQPDTLRTPGTHKMIHSVRCVFKSAAPFYPKISASVNYKVKLPAAPNSVADYSVSGWDSAIWDQAKWDSSGETSITSKWVSIGKSGFVVSTQVQITCGVTPFPAVELLSSEVLFESGGVMV